MYMYMTVVFFIEPLQRNSWCGSCWRS